MRYLEIKETEQILVVAPHPDDECIGAGGLLALYPKQCSVVVLTDGRQGQGEAAPEAEKSIRRKEFIQEMKAAGITSYWLLDYADGTLLQHTDCLQQMDLSVYSKIFVTGMQDGHADHTAACISVLLALEKQEKTGIEVYAYEVHTPLQCVTHALDITPALTKKVELIRFHRSQLRGVEYDRMAECLAWYRGIQNGSGRAACLEVYSLLNTAGRLGNSGIELEDQLQKYKLFYWVLTRWLRLRIQGVRMADILTRRNCGKIAIYGYAEIGQLLCRELLGEEFEVSYIMDKKVCESGYKNIPVFYPQKDLPKDTVVVTAVYYFDEIRDELKKMGFKDIYSFRELVEGI